MTILGLVIDILLIAVVVILGIIGLKKGFFKSIISLLSWSVCLIVAVLLAKYVASLLNHIYNFSGLIGGKIESGLLGYNEFFTKSVNTYTSSEELIAAIPNDINKLLHKLIEVVFKSSSVNFESEASIANVVGASLGQICMVIISAILLFLLLMLIVKLLSKFLDKLAKLKIVGAVNKILGLVFGVTKAFIIVIVLNCLLVALSLVPAVNKSISPLIQDNTHIEKVIYNETDKVIGEKVIEGQLIQKWIEDMWKSR